MYGSIIPGSDGCVMEVFNDAYDIAENIKENYSYDGVDVWLNLTNGVEVIPYLNGMVPYKFCRFRSCSFEQANWNDAIADMPDDMLMSLALGKTNYIVDFGANRPCPRALRQGFMIALRRISISWGLPVDEHMYICDRKGMPMRVSDEFARQSMRLDKKQKNRLDYFHKYLNTDKLNVKMMCAPTSYDGDYETHSNIVKWYYNG